MGGLTGVLSPLQLYTTPFRFLKHSSQPSDALNSPMLQRSATIPALSFKLSFFAGRTYLHSVEYCPWLGSFSVTIQECWGLGWWWPLLPHSASCSLRLYEAPLGASVVFGYALWTAPVAAKNSGTSSQTNKESMYWNTENFARANSSSGPQPSGRCGGGGAAVVAVPRVPSMQCQIRIS